MKPWTERLLDLETLLAKPDPRPDISAYHDMPYAIFHYPPSEELAFRRELNMLATRLRTQSAKRVTILSLAELLDKAVGSVMSWPELISDERTIGLPEVQDTLHQILSKEAPLPDLVASEMPRDPDPERDLVFLWRTACRDRRLCRAWDPASQAGSPDRGVVPSRVSSGPPIHKIEQVRVRQGELHQASGGMVFELPVLVEAQ